jgi:two-component system sensor histidine kinase KdpD
VLALGVFIAVGLIVSWIVDIAGRRTHEAARASAESQLMVTTAGSILRGQGTVDAVLERAREAFGMRTVSLLRCSSADGAPREWEVLATTGDPPVRTPDDADVNVPATGGRSGQVGRGDTASLTLAMTGRTVPAADRRVLGAFAAYASVAATRRRGRGRQLDRRRRPDAHRAARARSATTCARRWRPSRPACPACGRPT